jgi:hypothetical protein
LGSDAPVLICWDLTMDPTAVQVSTVGGRETDRPMSVRLISEHRHVRGEISWVHGFAPDLTSRTLILVVPDPRAPIVLSCFVRQVRYDAPSGMPKTLTAILQIESGSSPAVALETLVTAAALEIFG